MRLLVIFLIALIPTEALALTVLPVNSPELSSVPIGAQRIPVLTFILQAACNESPTITGVTVADRGLGGRGDIARVYMVRGVERVSRAATLSQDHTAFVRVRPLRLAPCAREEWTLAMDLAPEAMVASEHRFVLHTIHVEKQGVDQVIPVSVEGQTARVAGSSETGIITVEMQSLLLPLYASTRRPVARFLLEADASSAHFVSAIRFTNRGSAREGDLHNFVIARSDGAVLTDVTPGMQGKSVTVKFSEPFLLERSQSIYLELIADIRSGRRSVQFVLDEPSDVQATVQRGRMQRSRQ